MDISLELLDIDHQNLFVDAALRSAELHGEWVSSPKTEKEFAAQLLHYDSEQNFGFVCTTETQDDHSATPWRGTKEIVAWISITGIVRGAFQSGYMGYSVFSPFDGRGLMKESMRLVIAHAFEDLGLHRLEANIQPGNQRSSGLVKSLGFRLEGLSPRYLKVREAWRDHERYAITCEEFAK